MGKALRELPAACELWMLGDTEADIVAATTHQVKVIAVLSGNERSNSIRTLPTRFHRE